MASEEMKGMISVMLEGLPIEQAGTAPTAKNKGEFPTVQSKSVEPTGKQGCRPGIDPWLSHGFAMNPCGKKPSENR